MGGLGTCFGNATDGCMHCLRFSDMEFWGTQGIAGVTYVKAALLLDASAVVSCLAFDAL